VRLHLRRALLGLTTAAVATTGTLVPAQAATPEARSASGWLAAQLTDGLIVNTTEFGEFTNHGATLDVFFTLHGLGERSQVRADILDAMEDQVAAYTTFGGTTYAGAVAKLLTAVQTSGADPATYGDGSLLRTLRGRVVRSGPQAGRATDGPGTDYSNTIGQSFVVRAFAGAERGPVRKTTRFLLRQQCDAGFFRESMDRSDCQAGRGKGRSAASVDSTAYAVVALRAARRAGVTGLGDDIRDGLTWLRKRQRPSGAFRGNGVPNANSTGLAAWALAGSGWTGAAGTAAEWLARRQVTAGNSGGTPLAGEVGAIAYDQAAFAAGLADGITDVDRIQWQMATVQATEALDDLLPARALRVRAPERADRRETVTVRVRGLEAGERYTVRRQGAVVTAGWADKQGVARVKVRMPKRPKQVTVQVTGAHGDRVGSDVVRVR
jgi:hypothetical protein